MKYTGLNTKKILENWYGNHLIIAGESFIVGILTGLAITAFRKSIDFLSSLRIDFYDKAVSGLLNPAFGTIFSLGVLILTVIILGLFTRPAAFVLSGQMAFAYFGIHASFANILLPIVNQGELAALYSMVFLYFATAGSGAFALDNKRK